MDGFFVIFGLLVLAVPVLGVAGFFMANGARTSLRIQAETTARLDASLHQIAVRVAALDGRLRALEAGAPLAAQPPEPEPIAPEEHEAERRRRAAALLEAADRARRDDRGAAAGTGVDGTGAAPEAEPGSPATGPAAPETAAPEGFDDGRAARAEPAADAVPPFGPEVDPDFRPTAPTRGLEETLGTRWTVWVGGLALALGGVFLVKYSIEQGIFGPAARILIAALFSAALLAAGEFLRRNEIARAIGALPAAHIPGVLTAAGTVGAFATVYGAYALYGFLGPVAAFGAMGAVGLATLALAVLHGPWLAVLGVLGAYATPALVATGKPNIPALVIYLFVVTASAFGIARLRLWRWVAAAAFGLAAAWSLPILGEMIRPANDSLWIALHLAGLFALTAGLLVVSVHGTTAAPEDRPTDRFAVTTIAVLAALALLAQIRGDHDLPSRLLAEGLVLAVFALAYRVPAVVPSVLVAALFAVVSTFFWRVFVNPAFWADTFAHGTDGLVALRPRVIVEFMTEIGIAGLVLAGLGFFGARRATPAADRTAGWFALAGTIGPVLLLVVAWLRVSGFEPSFGFAALGLGLAAAAAAGTAHLIAREAPERPSPAVAVYAVGTIGALGAALAIGLEKGALTVALALIVPALAWVHGLRPIPTLRPLAALIGLVVLGRILWDPRIVGDDLGTTPIVNWLLYGYGIPAFGFAFAAWTFRRSGDDVWQRLLEALAVVFVGLLALFEIRHYAQDGDVFTPYSNLLELGLLATTGFLLSAGLARLAGRLGSTIYDQASMAATVIGIVIAGAGLFLVHNPMLTGDSTGDNAVFNGLFFGYLVPAAAAALAARFATSGRPAWFVTLLNGVALALAFAWMTLAVRRAWTGPYLLAEGGGDAELWTYSAAWLVFGVALLLGGLIRGSQAARIASAVIILLTITKVFLIDLSELTGIWRALSFIGLGGVLIGIGLLYQRLLFPAKRRTAE